MTVSCAFHVEVFAFASEAAARSAREAAAGSEVLSAYIANHFASTPASSRIHAASI